MDEARLRPLIGAVRPIPIAGTPTYDSRLHAPGGYMRTHTTIAALVAIVAPVLATAGSAIASDGTPGYRPVNQAQRGGVGAVDLVMPGATAAEARHAIADYVGGLGPRTELYFVKVVRAEDARRYVCRARWYADEHAAEVHSAGRFTAESWPALETLCPDGRGSAA